MKSQTQRHNISISKLFLSVEKADWHTLQTSCPLEPLFLYK
ncbi:hypothetical protein [Criibacterium bergeronii]